VQKRAIFTFWGVIFLCHCWNRPQSAAVDFRREVEEDGSDLGELKQRDRISHQFLTTCPKSLLNYWNSCCLISHQDSGTINSGAQLRTYLFWARRSPGTVGCCYYMHSIFLAFHHRSHTHRSIYCRSNTNSTSPRVCFVCMCVRARLPRVTLTVVISVSNLLSTSPGIITRQT
jgi:hypothetical protein